VTTTSSLAATPLRRVRALGSWLWLAVPLGVVVVAWWHSATLVRALGLLRQAELAWLVPAAAAIAGVYLARGTAYAVPLQLLGYEFPRRFLWSTALVASAAHQLIPSGGASSYAFLTYALHQRGATSGQASLVALIDTLSYAFALATLVLGAVVAVGVTGSASVVGVLAAFAPGFVFVALGAWLYWLQRDGARLTRAVARVTARLERRPGLSGVEARVSRFLAEYYAGKAVIARHPAAFFRMVGFQYLAVGCDAAALYLAFLALDAPPPLWVAFLGFVAALAGVSVAGAPGGGGSFEVIMSAFFASHGVDGARAVAATLLYRVVAFWLPVLASLGALVAFRRRRRELRRRPPAPEASGARRRGRRGPPPD